MKVIKPGTLYFDGGNNVFLNGWHFDGEGVPYATPLELDRAALACALRHIAAVAGAALDAPSPTPAPAAASPEERIPIEVERMALGAIRRAAQQ